MTNETTAVETELEFSRSSLLDEVQLSPEVTSRSRKNQSVILQKMQEVTGVELAARMGFHESQISRFKNGPLQFAACLLAAAGLKVVPADAVVYVKPTEYE
jgi:hypothetical protein